MKGAERTMMQRNGLAIFGVKKKNKLPDGPNHWNK